MVIPALLLAGALRMATEHDLHVSRGLERFRCSLDFPDHPVVGVSQSDAGKYAEWVGSVRNALPGSWSDFNAGFRCARDAD